MDRLALFPVSTKIENDSLTIAGHDLASLADRYLTPLYMYDRATLDLSAKAYTDALSAHYPASSHITYAGKAFLSLAMAQWAARQNLLIDCTGAGEIHVAVAAGVSRQLILVHGVNKSASDLAAAIQYAGTIVVDNLTELYQLVNLYRDTSQADFPELWLRLKPGLAVQTHGYTQTGQPDSKFGMSQAEVLRLLGQGRSNKEISQALFITDQTVKTHVSHILDKLGVPSRTQAALYAIRTGLVSAN